MTRLTIIPLVAMAFTSAIHGAPVSPSLQGYSGYFNIPSGSLYDSGDLNVFYSNQTEFFGELRDTHNFQFAVSLWDYVELSARDAAYTRTIGESSDMSANLKVRVPFIPENWFKLSLGIQDLGGQVDFFDSKFVAVSKDLEFINTEVTLGFGKSESRFDRIDGAFGGLKWSPVEWGSAIVEYDAYSINYGVEFRTPKHLIDGQTQFYTKVMLGASEDALADETFFSIGAQRSLVKDRSNIKPALISQGRVIEQNTMREDSLNLLAKALRQKGFDDFRLGHKGKIIVLQVENNLYSSNIIDTYSVVLALIARYSSDEFSEFQVSVQQNGITFDSVAGNIQKYQEFLRGGNLSLSSDKITEGVSWQDEAEPFFFKPRFTLYPHLVTAVGTEFGMFDYSLALGSHLELPVPVWDGLAITAFHLTQLEESKDFEDGQIFQGDRQQTGLQNLLVHQSFELPHNITTMLTYGQFSQDYTLTAAEAAWQSDSGRHGLFLYYGDYQYNEEADYAYNHACLNAGFSLSDCYQVIPEHEDKKVTVAKYQYYSPELNSTLLTKYGKFWGGDTGVHMLLSRHFDDFDINLSFKATKPDGDVDALSGGYQYQDEYTKMIGLGFTMRLGPRKDFNSKYVNVRGRPDWNYIVHTLVGERLNYLTYGVADEGRAFYHLNNQFSNYGRKGLSYLYENQDRLRSANFEL
ncbi:YjbH domain-containing protein [Gayadomonas joobiniege]|uniref:YjbH domain-containing protein n=1 Tax=Gayadomonas joobiniege TaxID=1234606 RepID=UPI00037AB7EB|nr:YjbH domain-containing protein [Gayadomonas joobiniege]